MKKPFDAWNSTKQKIHSCKQTPLYHEREIWYCSLGVNVGNEIDGTGKNYDRPVLVLKGFNKETFFGVALAGRKKVGRFYEPIGVIADREASVNLSQVKVVDTRRLVRKICTLDAVTFDQVRLRVRETLF